MPEILSVISEPCNKDMHETSLNKYTTTRTGGLCS